MDILISIVIALGIIIILAGIFITVYSVVYSLFTGE